MEKEWLDTLATVNPDEVTYTDYVSAGSMLAKELKEKGCHCVIALTHMRTPNDTRLAEEVPEIDLVLGGHDHVYEKKMVGGRYVLKSGTDFRQFSVISLDFSGERPTAEIEAVEVGEDFEPDNETASIIQKFSGWLKRANSNSKLFSLMILSSPLVLHRQDGGRDVQGAGGVPDGPGRPVRVHPDPRDEPGQLHL